MGEYGARYRVRVLGLLPVGGWWTAPPLVRWWARPFVTIEQRNKHER